MFSETDHMKLSYGSTGFTLLCDFFDTFNNPIEEFKDTDSFVSSTLEIYNADSMSLVT